MNKKNLKFILLILGALAAIGPCSIDMYLPAFPAIAQDLKTDISQVALSLTSFFIGISVGQLIYGPVLDRYGRRKPLIFGLIMFVIAAMGCAFAPNVHWLIGLRLLLALGGCSGMVACRAIVRDIFPIEEIAKAFSILMLVMGIAPIVAPSLGGAVVSSLGWRAIFFVLTTFGVLLLSAVIFFLPESRGADHSISLRPVNIVREYIRILKNPIFLTYTMCIAFASAGMFAYISGSPFVFMNLFGLAEKKFAWVFGFNAFGLIMASQLTRFLLRHFSSKKIVYVVSALQSVAGGLMISLTLAGKIRMPGTFALIFCYLFLQGFLYPNISALSLAPFHKNAGAASALTGFISMVCSAAASALVSYFHNGTAVPMTSVLAACSGLGFLCLLINLLWPKKNKAQEEENFPKEIIYEEHEVQEA